jgi:hypothetical protein
MELPEYTAILSAWADEAAELGDGFKSLFPKTTEGYMKYLFTLHFLVLNECLKRGIPEDAFIGAMPSIIGSWCHAGKPEGVELLCITGEDLKGLVERMRENQQNMGEKPSSDA